MNLHSDTQLSYIAYAEYHFSKLILSIIYKMASEEFILTPEQQFVYLLLREILVK